MPAATRHLRVGFLVHVLGVGPSLGGIFAMVGALDIGLVVAYGTLPATLLGSVAPDVDHPSSLVYQATRRWLPVVVAGSVGGVLTATASDVVLRVPDPGVIDPAFGAGVLTAVVAIGTWRGTSIAIPLLRPPHGGVVHTVTAGVVLTIGVGGYAATVAQICVGDVAGVVGLCLAGAFLTGYLAHLAQDRVLLPRLRET